MFKHKAPDGSNNLCGKNLKIIRLKQKPRLSQSKLARNLQLLGYDVDKHFIHRIENGKRFVTDVDLVMLAKALKISINELVE